MRRLPVLVLAALAGCTAAGRAGLEGRPQRRALSCEARSACDLLAFHGIAVSEEAFLARLPRSDNPDLGFVGDPDGEPGGLPPASYGVHAGPVAQALRSFGLRAEAVSDRDLEWLRSELDAGRPVLVWGTSGLASGERVSLRDARGRAFEAVRGEHCFLALATRGGRLVLLDPAHGEERVVDGPVLDASWALFRRAAVVASARPASGPTTRGERGRGQ
jgi:uncharacterized protein YvpB